MEHEPNRETEQNGSENVAFIQSLSFDLFDEAEDQEDLFESRTRLSSTCKLNRLICEELT